MVCHPGAIRGPLSNAGYKRQYEGTSESYNKLRCTHQVQCPVFNKTLTVESLQAHMRKVHRQDACSATAVTPPAEVSCTYKLNFVFRSENSYKIVNFPVQDCLYQEATATSLTLLSFLQSAPLTQFTSARGQAHSLFLYTV